MTLGPVAARTLGRRAAGSVAALVLTACGMGRVPAAEGATAMTPRHVEVVRDVTGWALRRDGQLYPVRGVGTTGRLSDVRSIGANSVRTWGTGPGARAFLDEAEELGLSVTQGLWLGHVGHGFDWNDPASLAEQRARVRRDVIALRDHPALLFWGLGNEMEIDNDDPAMWAEVGALAAMVRELDPHHPIVVVTADLGEANDARLREYVPGVVWGINSYGGAPSLPRRLAERGYEGPWLLTEVGPLGDWETGRTSWGAPIEQSSAEKRAAIARALQAADAPACLGVYGFVWGPGEVPLDTWFPLLGPGERLMETAAPFAEAWGAEARSFPQIRRLEAPFSGQRVAPGTPLLATLEVDGAQAITWALHVDRSPLSDLPGQIASRGSGASVPLRCSQGSARFEEAAPLRPGPYRLLAFAEDACGGVAYASARFWVTGHESPELSLPFWLEDHYAPSGFMGDASARVSAEPCPAEDWCQGACRGFRYRAGEASDGWAAVAWMHPEGNWSGRQPGVHVPPETRVVTFRAWGAKGGEEVSFFVGNWEVDGFSRKLEDVVLEATPQSYRLELDAGLRDDLVFGFGWAAVTPEADMEFRIADVTFHSAAAAPAATTAPISGPE
ncbi:MAG: glycoside hydrolase family 2 TIM barrel-domain containing protein [Myxococcota bacterium]